MLFFLNLQPVAGRKYLDFHSTFPNLVNGISQEASEKMSGLIGEPAQKVCQFF